MTEAGNNWSVTDRELHDSMRSLREEDTIAAVATIVGVEGSAYRRPGAKLVAPVGEGPLGAITAGCLEGPVADLAAAARETGTVAVETFDLMDDDEWGVGLGCNGIIDVLVEPLDDSFNPLLSALAKHDRATVLTVIESADADTPVGARTIVTEAGAQSGEGRVPVPEDVLANISTSAEQARESGSTARLTVERDAGDVEVFIDGVKPAPQLLLFGAQNDVRTVAMFGAQVGFHVTVASPRGAKASDDLYPHAHNVQTAHPTKVDDVIAVDDQTYAILMSHNLIDDRLALETLLDETQVPYIGLMGPRSRFENLNEEAAADGRTFTQSDLKRISTPVGLNLGDGSPTGIALSIVSEVLAVANDAPGGRLSEESGPIHKRSN